MPQMRGKDGVPQWVTLFESRTLRREITRLRMTASVKGSRDLIIVLRGAFVERSDPAG